MMQSVPRSPAVFCFALSVLVGFSTANATEISKANLLPGSNTVANQAPTARTLGPELSSPNELYSETYYQNLNSGAATQIRLRHEWALGSEKTRLYFGAVLERNLNAQGAAPLIQSATSPEVGLLYRPTDFLTVWGEYRYRIVSQTSSPSTNESDPRLGLAAGRSWAFAAKQLNAEIYYETIWVPRLSRAPVGSGFLRLEAVGAQAYGLTLSAYSELNHFASSDHEDFGPNRTQVRAGGRVAYRKGEWSASLFAYRPWLIDPTRPAPPLGLEGLFVLGGRF